MEEFDQLCVIRKDQLAEHLRGGKQAVLVSQILVDPNAIGKAHLLKHVAKVHLEEIGVNPVEIVDPVRVQ